MKQYLPHEIEPKWQALWDKKKIYAADDTSNKEKSYILIEFPYPSGERLHVGHSRSYCALDSVARLRRMRGFNVLYPIGWDAFGLPAENYAIKTGIHPSITVKKNIQNAKEQALSWGLSFDWQREINTTSPKYYKWTQWIFLQLYNNGLAYRDEITVNWCPSCKTNLANEEVISGTCERCGHETERKMQKQWLLRITEYAQRLLDDLETVNYRQDIKTQQINWIGRKEGLNINYSVEGSNKVITCFTTRPDTNFGATFVVLAPEHPLAINIATKEHKEDVSQYIKTSLKKSELDRQLGDRNKTGVFTGSYVINKLNGSKLPVYISDFVLTDVGTGALVGVPAHDKRDFEFAKLFNLPIVRTVVADGLKNSEISSLDDVYEGHGITCNSGFLNGMSTEEAMQAVSSYVEREGFGKRTVDFHLRDWVFSRQHYWGEPIPIIHCSKCGEVALQEIDLPLELPHVDNYQPTDSGESPLSAMTEWVNVKCSKCGGDAKRETDTMPNWAGSSWYYLRYIDPSNSREFASKEKLDKWLPVDWYNGGLEHTTLHLLYSRFWHKFLYDQGHVPTAEPYKKRTSHGVVLGPDGSKMSKSKGNVINPDEIVSAYGADAMRIYIMFIGPFEQNVNWSNESVMGVRRFLNRIWTLAVETVASKTIHSSALVLKQTYKTVEKVEKDIESMKFNTAVSALMETLNFYYQHRSEVGKDVLEIYTLLLATCAPHLAEELWELLGNDFSVHQQPWPTVDSKFLKESISNIIVQVNGKTRGTIEVDTSNLENEAEIVLQALSALNMREKYGIDNDTARIYANNKVLNFVTK